MSTVQIVIGSVSAPFSDKGHTKMDMTYSQGGKDTSRKLVRLGDSIDAFDVLKEAKRGDTFDIEMIKKGDYWNWVKASKAEGGAVVSSSTPQSTTKSTYETSEERSVKQLHIARQSSLGYAVSLLGPKSSVDQVTKVAQSFVDFVYNGLETGEKEAGAEEF